MRCHSSRSNVHKAMGENSIYFLSVEILGTKTIVDMLIEVAGRWL